MGGCNETGWGGGGAGQKTACYEVLRRGNPHDSRRPLSAESRFDADTL